MKAIWAAMVWDWRLLYRSGSALLAVAILLVAAILAGWSGVHSAAAWRGQVDLARASSAQAHEELIAHIAAGKDPYAALPYRAKALIALPPAPLADLAVGRGDIDPRTAEASAFGQAYALFRNYEIASPLALSLGRFDLAFVVQVLLPLLIVVLGYGLFAEEREQGLDRVLALQEVSSRRLLLSRVLARASLLLAPLLAVMLAAHVAGTDAVGTSVQRVPRMLLSLALILGYAGFWWGLVAWLGTWRLRAAQTLLALLAAWVLLVLVVPALVGLLARDAHRPPSRFELIAAARSQESAGLQRSQALLGQYAHDHPDMDAAAQTDMPAWARTTFLASRSVDAAVAPVLARFDRALLAQQALVQRWQYASPALIVQRGLLTAAGTDERRQRAFREQALAFFGNYREHTGKMIMKGIFLDAKNLAALPRFAFKEPAVAGAGGELALPIAILWLLSIALFVAAFRRAAGNGSAVA
jgi:ABC-2 type transport system permease protein